MSARTYSGERVDVTFDARRCLHAAECLRGLPDVFDVKRKPWILPDGSPSADAVADVVARCPSGALHVVRKDAGGSAEPSSPAVVSAPEDGPLWVRGAFVLEVDGEQVPETRAALCRCGQSENRPFCDASGPCTGWREG